MKSGDNNIYIGASGWSYKDWTDGVFYPPDIASKDWLKYYSEQFNTVEINASFYHQISIQTYAKWYRAVPKDFVFSVKMSRYLTHIKRLNDTRESWQKFIAGAGELKGKLGPILFQLPENFKIDVKKLENLLKGIRYPIGYRIPVRAYKVVFELRHESWFCDDIYSVLKKYNACLVISDSGKWPSKEVITADFIYIRMHGPSGLYDSKYTDKQLRQWAERIKKWTREVKDIYVYFNNDYEGYAIDNAKSLQQLLNRQ
jgi:uncharacterized protein YecE (DUF72 family)